MGRAFPALAESFRAAVRAHRLDLAAVTLLYAVTSLIAGRVWRYPFDDEVYTLNLIGRISAADLALRYPGRSDVHPPLSYLLFQGLQELGFSEAGMRFVSWAMTAGAIVLVAALAFRLLAERGPAPRATRLVAVALFGLMPLAVAQGDALRWYPLFALTIALFLVLYLAGTNRAALLWAAAALGLAGSTNVLAGPVAIAFAVYRYGLQRRWRPPEDIAFWAVAALTGALGAYTVASLVLVRTGQFGPQLFDGVALAAATNGLGFFGGTALGVSRAWIAAPAAIVALPACAAAVDRRRPDAATHLCLLVLAVSALTTFAGFGKPRSFLYLAPVVALLVTLYLDRWIRDGRAARAGLVAAALSVAALACIGEIDRSAHPFKRNSVVPFDEIFSFVERNKEGRVLVLSTDPVVPWVLERRNTGDLCTGLMQMARQCLADGRRYDTIFVVSGHSDRSGTAAMARYEAFVRQATAGRTKRATLGAGLDEDAPLKTRLTGVPLSRTILTVDVYR